MIMQQNVLINLPNEKASQRVATQFARCLSTPIIITFSGEIGAGKTTFIRALLQSLGVLSTIKSPTFSLVESYQGTHRSIHHFDLYRIHDETELDYIGFTDYFTGDAICCIEWPERAKNYCSFVDIECKIKFNLKGRDMQILARTDRGADVLACFVSDL